MTSRLDRLLRPRSLAFVGGAAAELAIDACCAFGFDGDMWAVNPRRRLRGLTTFASADELPAGVDAAFVGVERRTAVEVVRELATLGTGAAVCHASGFAETGEAGEALQAELVQAAAGMPLIGPNCYGTLSAVTGAALWPDVHGLARCDRGVALLSQSGNIAVNLTMQRRGLDVAWVMALGNQADVGLAEALEALVADEAVTGVGLVMEAVDDVRRFAAAAHSAWRRDLPVVALKLGTSQSAGDIAVTHTASLVGDAAAYDALFRRVGIQRVHTVPELLDTLSVLCTVGPLKGNRLVSLSCSGGEAALVADRSQGLGLSFPPFAADHAKRVAAALDGRVAVTNPLDYHTFIWDDQDRLTECFSAALGAGPLVGSSAPFDAALLVLDFPAEGVDRSRWWPTLEAFGAACAEARTPGVVVASMAENLPEEARARAAALSLAACGDIDTALSALAAAAALGRRSARLSPDSACLLPPASGGGSRSSVSSASSCSSVSLVEPDSSIPAMPPGRSQRTYGRGVTADSHEESPDATEPPLPQTHGPDQGSVHSRSHSGPLPRAHGPDATAATESAQSVLSEQEAKLRLAAAGIAVPRGDVVAAEQARAAAAEIGYPVVVKAVGTAHKTEIGGVVVGLTDSDAVATAAGRLSAEGVEAVLVESCVTDAVAELLVGVRSSPPVGMLLTLGAGGTLAELVDDTASLLLSVEPGKVLEALQGLRVWPLLDGFRGRPPAAVDAVVEAVGALSALVRDDRRIVEVEINPLMVTPHAAVAADALMLVAEPQVHD